MKKFSMGSDPLAEWRRRRRGDTHNHLWFLLVQQQTFSPLKKKPGTFNPRSAAQLSWQWICHKNFSSDLSVSPHLIPNGL